MAKNIFLLSIIKVIPLPSDNNPSIGSPGFHSLLTPILEKSFRPTLVKLHLKAKQNPSLMSCMT